MTIARQDWNALGAMQGGALKKAVFQVMRDAALAINESGEDDPALLEVVPRLANLMATRQELESFREVFSSLARATGLWNYIDKSTADGPEALIAEAVTVPELDNVTLHREQVAALNGLLSGQNLILSAPTSFGKSLLVDALLATRKYRRIAIVLPTIALLDEFRRRIKRRFGDGFHVVMHPSDQSTDAPTIFLGTQERLINRADLGKLDLTVVDEFYKLDPARRDERSVMLNAAVHKLLGRSRQFFFLGPNIDGVKVSGDGRWNFRFFRTRFSTVAVDTFDLHHVEDKRGRLLEELAEDEHWPALVFVSSPDKANRLAVEAAQAMAVSDESAAFASWLADNVGTRWPLVEAVKYGFAVHHGRLPRAIAAQMVRLFNTRALPVLFCTSTLIEGVNTAAKTVFIFDKAINRARYDFFTYSNIKGRAGRLGQHHVGKVFLFNKPPEQIETEVAPTLFADEDDAPDDYVVYLDEPKRADVVDNRVGALGNALGLSPVELRLAASIGLDDAAILKEMVERSLRQGRSLVWHGVPKYQDLVALTTVIGSVRKPSSFGLRKMTQLPLFISRLRAIKSMRDFLRWYDESYQGDLEQYDNVFKFLRTCEYGLPQIVAVIELFAKKLRPEVDYSVLIQGLSRWFKPEELKDLDEEGIPIQIAERFYTHGDTRQHVIHRLTQAVRQSNSAITAFERQWLIGALELTVSSRP
ncbi:DEAD/DEAH box helicase [Cupriavidus sp. GA3-3]|uniref:DEAD/DEAH box helicase n=1 Tax=Cupriavidus sp. GA3-3 TaxID=1229514 RepID=UPI00039E1061|nr:DEAD/DEAH box helicase [Cupriavidus sp. GA3-3]